VEYGAFRLKVKRYILLNK